MLDWRINPPEGTEVRLFIPSWKAEQVVALADALYPQHEIRAVDAHTVAVPGGGTRYVSIPTSAARQTGVVSVHFPIGVKRGQRFDLAVRQVTTRGRPIKIELPKEQRISLAEAAKLLERVGIKPDKPSRGTEQVQPVVPRGVFEIGANQTLFTDLSVLDAAGEGAVLIEHPGPKRVEQARRDAGRWRETIGAFQLGIPVLVKAEMLNEYLRLLSVLRWRAELLPRTSRWHATFLRYVELIAEKVRALGGNPWTVPATPDGAIPLGDGQAPPKGEPGGTNPPADADAPFFEPGDDEWLAAIPVVCRPRTLPKRVRIPARSAACCTTTSATLKVSRWRTTAAHSAASSAAKLPFVRLPTPPWPSAASSL